MNKNIEDREPLTSEFMQYVLSRILDYANDSFDDYSGSEFDDGRRLAYVEMINVIKNDLYVRGYTLEELGLKHVRDLERLFLER